MSKMRLILILFINIISQKIQMKILMKMYLMYLRSFKCKEECKIFSIVFFIKEKIKSSFRSDETIGEKLERIKRELDELSNVYENDKNIQKISIEKCRDLNQNILNIISAYGNKHKNLKMSNQMNSINFQRNMNNENFISPNIIIDKSSTLEFNSDLNLINSNDNLKKYEEQLNDIEKNLLIIKNIITQIKNEVNIENQESTDKSKLKEAIVLLASKTKNINNSILKVT